MGFCPYPHCVQCHSPVGGSCAQLHQWPFPTCCFRASGTRVLFFHSVPSSPLWRPGELQIFLLGWRLGNFWEIKAQQSFWISYLLCKHIIKSLCNSPAGCLMCTCSFPMKGRAQEAGLQLISVCNLIGLCESHWELGTLVLRTQTSRSSLPPQCHSPAGPETSGRCYLPRQQVLL